MIRSGLVILLACWGVGPQVLAQQVYSHAQADSALALLRGTLARDPAHTVSVTARIVEAYGASSDRCGLAEAMGIRSGAFTELGKLDSALACAHRVFRLFTSDCDSVVLMRGFTALSHVSLSLREFPRADSVANAGLTLWRKGWKPSSLRNAMLTNQAIARANLGDLAGAEASFRRILAYATEEGSYQDINDANSNLGAIKSMQGRTDSAIVYTRAALENARVFGKTNRMAVLYSNLAHLEYLRERHIAALALNDSALVYAREVEDLPLQITIHKGFYRNHAGLGQYKEAFDHALERFILNDSLLNGEKLKAITEMQEKYESEKKAREIIGLRADKLEGELQKSRVERTRNIYLLGGIGVLLAAGGLWNRLRFVARSREAIRKERDRSEELLLNILPEEVASELKEKGEAEARLIEHVSVLFTDFRGFTAMSEQLSPKELVRDIHECFSAFDRIMEKYGIEKIKTIGDAYMAAGGLPVPNSTHAHDVVRAALDIRDFINEGKALKIAAGLPYFEIRIGIHTGPVVAGIVGVKKFAYDIWGDTVNTASRMESSGGVGQVNISEATYARLVEPQSQASFTAPEFTFIPRGEVQAKGKGAMAMYFVDRA